MKPELEQPSTAPPGRSIVISPDDTTVSLAQALYHHVTTKTERIVETFFDNYVISETDTYQICHILKQIAQRHHESEWSCVIDHALFRKSRTRHSSLERFKVSDKSQNDTTSEIVITYDFLTSNPYISSSEEIRPERYKIVLRISQESYLAINSTETSQPAILRRLLHMPSVTVEIQYVDYTIARAILAAVREWVDALERSSQSKIAKLFSRHEFTISETLPAILAACILIGAAGISPVLSDMTGRFLFSVLAVMALTYGLGTIVSESLLNSIYNLHSPTLIKITRGDEKHISQVQQKITKAKAVVSVIFIGIALSILVNISSSLIYHYFFEP